MNALFVTQGLGLRFFDRLSRALVDPLRLDRRGFYVCDSLFYQRYLDEMPDFPDCATGIVKEWDIVAAAEPAALDRAARRRSEERLNVGPCGTVWSVTDGSCSVPGARSFRTISRGSTTTRCCACCRRR